MDKTTPLFDPIVNLPTSRRLEDLRERLLRHPIYSEIDDLQRLRHFMESHVFAVWDFMSLTKRLQRDLTCTTIPWMPGHDASLARFINEVVVAEESDEGLDGVPKSHVDLYLDAMREVDADTSSFNTFLEELSTKKNVQRALAAGEVPEHVRDFVTETLRCAIEGSIVEACASFFYGREDLIPPMFRRLLRLWPRGAKDVPLFSYYLQRHIDVDGDSHGPAAREMLRKLVDGNAARWSEAAASAESTLHSRIRLWDGVLNTAPSRP